MAKLIEYYIPLTYRSRVKWVPAELRGKVLEFKPKAA